MNEKRYEFDALPMNFDKKRDYRDHLGANRRSVAGAILGTAALPKGPATENVPPEFLATTSLHRILNGELDHVLYDAQRAGLQLESPKYGSFPIADVRMHRDFIVELAAWAAGPLALGKPNGSLSHACFEDWARPPTDPRRLTFLGLIDASAHSVDADEALKRTMERAQIFLVEHDWAAALKTAKDFNGGEWRLPFPCTVIELVIDGKRVVAMFDDSPGIDSGFLIDGFLFIRGANGRWAFAMVYGMKADGSWVQETDRLMPFAGVDRIWQLVADEMRAMAIALDAEIVQTEVIRAPHKLNRARERNGRLPILDHHVVNLSRRIRAAPAELPAGESRASPRLHFRRGHWRHYAERKTWIKWTLVGDPDLGRIEKEYRL